MSGGLVSAVDPAQTLAVNTLLGKVFDSVISLMYTVVDVFINFFSQPVALGSLASIGVIFIAWRAFKKRTMGTV